MKHRILAIAFLFFSLIFAEMQGQEIQTIADETPQTPSGLYIGAQATTNGLGFNINYIAGYRLTLKTGVESLKYNFNFPYEENDINYDATFQYKTGGIFLLADYFYAKSLYLSGGVVMNNFQPKFEGVAASEMTYGDIIIPASKVGDFRFEVEPELKFSPYVAAGFRKFFGKTKMVSWNFETGLYYMGPPKLNIQTTGLLAPTSDPAHSHQQYLENQFSVYKYYPVMKFALGIRLI